ncbi:hypothetical protein HD554DRAFT_2204196 [Boletus coccyginus]|nr:hypothetical protein HD554DRAFT_2204196 [Boletus coccyginus]
MLNNPNFKNKFDYCVFTYMDSQGQRCWTDFMSGNYTWRQSICAACKEDNDATFQLFKKKLFHTSISTILQPVKSAMITPMVCHCPDGYWHHVIFDLAAFIADYPEQVMLSGIPFTNDFPHVNIHAMISPYLLYQLIKGTFKDHLMIWTCKRIEAKYKPTCAKEILDDIDWHLAMVPHFTGLHRFPHGRWFKQWTGDDSKALVKIYLPAITEYVSPQLVQCLVAFLDFCYIVYCSELGLNNLKDAENVLVVFHLYREVSNGLCSSITKSCHITAVKQPWHHWNWYNALGQMLLTIQHLNKLAAVQVLFVLIPHLEHRYITQLTHLAVQINKLQLPHLVHKFLETQYNSLLTNITEFQGPITIFHLAAATFFAPSDLSCQDCVFMIVDQDRHGMRGMVIGHIHIFFSFIFNGKIYPCILVDRAAHLIPVYGKGILPPDLDLSISLDVFHSYYVNKYSDHYTNEVAF